MLPHQAWKHKKYCVAQESKGFFHQAAEGKTEIEEEEV
jgi:hypothetical protein